MVPLEEEARILNCLFCALSRKITPYLEQKHLTALSKGMQLVTVQEGWRATTIIDARHGIKGEMLLLETLLSLEPGDIVRMMVDH
jgi:hypothetical protein